MQLLDEFGYQNWSDPVGDNGEVHAWRSAHWNNYMFEIEAMDTKTGTITFGLGGFQGAVKHILRIWSFGSVTVVVVFVFFF